MDRIDQREIRHAGRSLTVVIVPDGDARPTDYECYTGEDLAAWSRGDWQYVGVLIMDGDTELDALWAVEYGSMPTGELGLDHIVGTHPVPDMLSEVL